MNEKVLGHFLRYKREHADLTNYAIDQSHNRRTPGLTREEVADLAHVSVDWVTRIEQGRPNATPSAEVLNALCQGLSFSQPEIEYVFSLLHLAPPQTAGQAVSATVLDFIERRLVPAFVMDQNFNLMATNATFQALYGTWDEADALANNWVWRIFQSEAFRQSLVNWPAYAAYVTAVFRKGYSDAADSPALFKLYQAVQADPVFDHAWNTLAVSDFQTQYLFLNRAVVGELYLVENVFAIPDTKQWVVFEDAGDGQTQAKLQQLNQLSPKQKALPRSSR